VLFVTNVNCKYSNTKLPKNKLVDKPIQIVNFATGNEASLLLQPRNLVVVGENSHVQIIERHQSLIAYRSVFYNNLLLHVYLQRSL
jgi:Fe-S cluster assembly protein SufD